MIPGVTAGQVEPHTWSGRESLGGRGGLQSVLRFGLSTAVARFAGAGRTVAIGRIPILQASAMFVGAGRLLDLSDIAEAYYTVAVHFPGTAWLQREAWLTGVGATNKFLFSAWIKLSASVDGLFAITPSGSDFLQQGVTSSGGIQYFNMNVADSYFDTFPNAGMVSSAWQHILISVDISAAPSVVKQFYLNSSDISSSANDAFGTDTSVSAGTDFYFADDGFGGRITGDVADVQMWMGLSLDLSIAANRELFILGGRPVNPTIASQALGTPTILFSGNTTNFIINQGSGGAFTLHGSLTNATSSPSPHTWAGVAQWAAATSGVFNADVLSTYLQGSGVFAGTGSISATGKIPNLQATAAFVGAGNLLARGSTAPLSMENQNSTSFSFNASPTVDVTTSGTDRVIVLYICANRATDTVVITSVTATGLTFTKRFGDVYNPFGRPVVTEIWWAHAASQQTSKTITVAFDVAPSDGVLQVASVVNADTSSPWDGDASLTADQNQAGAGNSSTPQVAGVSTSNSEDILFTFFDTNQNATVGAPTGFTQVGYVHEGASADCTSGWWYKILDTTQSSISLQVSSGTSSQWVFLADAIKHN